jgi:alpha-aminoadipate carrier protein LysW
MSDTTISPTTTAPCPVCDAAVALPSDALQGEVLACDDCGAELELTSIQPPTLGEAPEVSEDWGE